MLDHVGVAISDFARSRAFYKAALAPLGIDLIVEFTAAETGAGAQAGFGTPGKLFFWIGDGKTPPGAVHIAFSAAGRPTVDAFHAAAMAVGARDNGAPGLRPHYHADYYGAFVLDPDGNNIEAVCHKPA